MHLMENLVLFMCAIQNVLLRSNDCKASWVPKIYVVVIQIYRVLAMSPFLTLVLYLERELSSLIVIHAYFLQFLQTSVYSFQRQAN